MKISKRLILGATVALVAASGLGALMLTSSKTALADEAKTVTVENKNEFASTLLDETVYVFLNADGEVKKTISSDWAKNDLGADVYTKTEGKVSAPITVGVSYYLDGKKVSADEIRGRSGHIKIRYDYTNTQRVNGLYMPYAVVSGAVLSNEHFSNILVTNAKAINDGTRTTVVGLALPGMKENLGVNLDIPEYVEIEADAKDFKMEMTATLASAQVFANVDTSALNSISSLSSQLDLLVSSMNQLLDGSIQIRDGLATLNSKTSVLADGVSQLRAGSFKLTTGMSSLSDGLKTAYDGSTKIAGGLTEVYNKVKDSPAKMTKAYEGAKGINEGVNKLLGDLNGGFAQLNANDNNTKLISGATSMFNAVLGGLKNGSTTPADIKAIFADVTLENYGTEVKTLMENYGSNNTVKGYLDQLSFFYGVIQYVSGVNQIAGGLTTNPKVAELKTGMNELTEGLKTSGEDMTKLSSGLAELSTGATKLSTGLSDAYTGSKSLATGMASLDAGISNLASNIPALTDGVSKLANGSASLSDGLAQFNEQGVQKLVSLYNGNVKALIERVQAIISLAKSADSKTKYIYKTAEI